jgi:hypothetical protein
MKIESLILFALVQLIVSLHSDVREFRNSKLLINEGISFILRLPF